MSGYLGSKRPNDVVQVTYTRDGERNTVPVTLLKYEAFVIEKPGLEVREASKDLLKEYGVKNGVVISQATNEKLKRYGLNGILITEIDEEAVESVDDVKRIMNAKNPNEPVSISFVGKDGEKKQIIFQ